MCLRRPIRNSSLVRRAAGFVIFSAALTYAGTVALGIRDRRNAQAYVEQLGGDLVLRSQTTYVRMDLHGPPPRPTAFLKLWEPKGPVAWLPPWVDRGWVEPVTVVRLESKQIPREVLISLGTLPTLEFLDLSGATFSADDLAALKGCRSLTYLNLYATGVGDAGVGFLASTGLLKELDLSRTRVTDRCLATVARLPDLKLLGLDGTQITSAGLTALTACRNLEQLQLYETEVNDEGLPNLKRITSLRHLDLRETNVTPSGVDDLRRALPHCAIYWERALSGHRL